MGDRAILDNGIQLGGVFRDYHERVTKLESENALLIEENDKLVSENQGFSLILPNFRRIERNKRPTRHFRKLFA